MQDPQLVTYRNARGFPAAGAVVGGRVFDLEEWMASFTPTAESIAWSKATGRPLATCGVLRLLQSGLMHSAELRGYLEKSHQAQAPSTDIASAMLYAPIPNPGKIVAIGRNYADHAKETGVAPFERPRVISKFASSLCGHKAVVPRGRDVQKLDFEVELAVVIGHNCRSVSAADASNYIAGYTVLNDLSARELQFDVSPAQTTYAKSGDGFAPMGPCLVALESTAITQGLDLSLHLNGVLMQRGNTRDLLFPVDVLIEYISHHCTLEVGDVVATGTPAGSGAFRDPPLYLQPGDSLRLEVQNVGVLEHSIA